MMQGGGGMKLVCYGDSNTYGYDPEHPDGRYGGSVRWADAVARSMGMDLVNLGRNGREIPRRAPEFADDAALITVMLGTNDLLRGCTAERAARRMEDFLGGCAHVRDKLVLIAPVPVRRGSWVTGDGAAAASREYAALCSELALRCGVRFADAGKWGVALARDGVHFTPEGHRAFAAGLLAELRKGIDTVSE